MKKKTTVLQKIKRDWQKLVNKMSIEKERKYKQKK